jgi:hypothetical protein
MFVVCLVAAVGSAAGPAMADGGAIAVETRAAAVAIGLGTLTGLAISPVLVLSLFGVVTWWNAAEGTAVPLFAEPWFWAPLLAISCLAILARSGCLVFPGSKYLLDVPKQIHSKLTGLVAAGMLLPTLVSSLKAAGIAPAPSGEVSQAGLIAWSIAPVAVVMFLSVWIVANTIDALVFLSPFALVDACLLGFRAAVLGLVLAATAIDSWLGFPLLTLLVCVPIIVTCMLLAAPCLRLNLFAFVCAWDFLSLRWRRTDAGEGPIRSFVASRTVGIPVRTMGHAEPVGTSIRFRWRPFLILPRRTIEIPGGDAKVVRGVVWSAVTVRRDGIRHAALTFPPRYRGQEPVLAGRFGAEIEDGVLLRGIKGTIAFVRRMFGFADRSDAVTG